MWTIQDSDNSGFGQSELGQSVFRQLRMRKIGIPTI
jgi:hypothetical protein